MKHVDDRVVSTLISTASALRLLGADAVLTGIRPAVAQAMVAFGQRLDSLVTLGTLESGIAYALRRGAGGGPGGAKDLRMGARTARKSSD